MEKGGLELGNKLQTERQNLFCALGMGTEGKWNLIHKEVSAALISQTAVWYEKWSTTLMFNGPCYWELLDGNLHPSELWKCTWASFLWGFMWSCPFCLSSLFTVLLTLYALQFLTVQRQQELLKTECGGYWHRRRRVNPSGQLDSSLPSGWPVPLGQWSPDGWFNLHIYLHSLLL